VRVGREVEGNAVLGKLKETGEFGLVIWSVGEKVEGNGISVVVGL
jgi:hypothetical protein